MTNDVMAIWCSEKNTHDSIVSDNTGNIYSQISTESFVRKYYQMKPLWTFSIGKCIILLVEMEPTVFLPAKCDGLW